jgi:hypothetical protein
MEDFERFGYSNAEGFRVEFLERLRSVGLLYRQGVGKDALYALKGFAHLAIELKCLR